MMAAEKHITNQQLKKEVLDMLKSLRNSGMNCPLLDSENLIDKELQFCKHFWLTPKIPILFEVLNLIGKRAWNAKLTTQGGNQPLHVNNKPAKRVLDFPVTPLLPKNWYCEEWYNHLELSQKTDLKAAKFKALPNIVSVSACFCLISCPNQLIFSKIFKRLLKGWIVQRTYLAL